MPSRLIWFRRAWDLNPAPWPAIPPAGGRSRSRPRTGPADGPAGTPVPLTCGLACPVMITLVGERMTARWRLPALAATALLAMALPIGLRAHVHPFEVLGPNEGLPQSQVGCVTQDQEGYIWAGTWGGLARFNGSAFAYLNTDTGLPSNRIQKLLAARTGDLWIATADGVALWKDHAPVVPKDPLVAHIRCRTLAEDASGAIWIGTDRGAVVSREGTFRRVGPAGGPQPLRVFDLLPEAPGVLAVTSEGLFALSASGESRPVEAPPTPRGTLRAALRTAEGLWVGTQGHGL